MKTRVTICGTDVSGERDSGYRPDHNAWRHAGQRPPGDGAAGEVGPDAGDGRGHNDG